MQPEGHLPPVRQSSEAAVERSPPSIAVPLASSLLPVQSTCSDHNYSCTQEPPHAGVTVAVITD